MLLPYSFSYKSYRCKTSNTTDTQMIILGDDGIRSQYVPPKATVKILKRPTADSRGSGDGPLMNGDKPKQPIKSLKQVYKYSTHAYIFTYIFHCSVR